MKHWLPVAIFLIAFGLRLIGVTQSPPNPYWEEAALGYDAYSILRTGKDHHGNVLPLVAFPSFGDYKPSLYFYTVVPSVALFGLNTLAVRLPAVLASSATVLFLFLLLRKWAGEKVAFWSSILLAFQPWSWQVGRAGFETNLATMLLVAGVFVLTSSFGSLEKQGSKKRFWFFSLSSAALFALSMYAYHGARLLAPLFAVPLFVLHFDWPKKMNGLWLKIKVWIPTVLLALVLVWPILMALQTPVIQQRIAETSIFTLPDPVERSNKYRELSGNTLLSRILFHRYWFWAEEIFGRYASHLSPSFLFISGDQNPRHTSQWFGSLFPWEIITLLLGFVYGARHFRRRKWWYCILALLFLSPLAAAFTLATPHALRALPLSPWLAVVSAAGLLEIAQRIQKAIPRFSRLVPLSIFGGILLSWLILAFYFFTQYRIEYASQWQDGYQPLFDTLVEHKKEGEPVYVSRFVGRPAMYLFFTQKIDPTTVQAEESNAKKDQLERLTFQDWSFIDGVSTESGLHAQPFGELPTGASPIEIISGIDEKPIWIIYRR